MTDDDAAQVRRAQQWLARRARLEAWTTIALGIVAFVTSAVLLAFGKHWAAGFVGAGLAITAIGILWLNNARRTRAALDRSAREGRDDESVDLRPKDGTGTTAGLGSNPNDAHK